MESYFTDFSQSFIEKNQNFMAFVSVYSVRVCECVCTGVNMPMNLHKLARGVHWMFFFVTFHPIPRSSSEPDT